MSSRNNRYVLDIDTTLAPITAEEVGTFDVNLPFEHGHLLRLGIAQLAGDATTFDWAVRATTSDDPVDQAFYGFDMAQGAPSTNGSVTVAKTYAWPQGAWSCHGDVRTVRVLIGPHAGIGANNTYRILLAWEAVDGHQSDVAIPAPV